MRSRGQLIRDLLRIEDCLSGEYQLRAGYLTDNEPTQGAMRDAINISRHARGDKKMEPNDF